MKIKFVHFFTLFIILVSVSGLVWWLFTDPTSDFSENLPGMDNRPANLKSSASMVQIGEFYQWFDSLSTNLTGKWPRFRGSNFDNKSSMAADVDWGESGPNILWSVELGEGHAAPAVYNGRVYLLDYDEIDRADVLRCLSLETGTELWRRWYKNPLKRNHGMSRTVPAVNEKYVVTIGPNCHVMCVDADSGSYKWGINLVDEYDTKVPLWYTGQCPLLEDSIAIIAPGGPEALIMGVDCDSGNVVWKTPNPNNWGMSHSSIMPLTFQGKKMYVYCAFGGIVGISAEPEDIGTILWQSTEWNPNVIAPSPVFLPDGRIFVTAGYGAGSMMFQLVQESGEYKLNVLDILTPKDGLASEQQTPILYDGHLFCVLPKDAGPDRNQLVCSDPDNIRSFVWTSGKSTRFGLGPFILLDDKFFVLSDDGELTVLKASTQSYQEIAKAKILDGHDAWGPIAVADNRMLCRDSKTLVCIQL